MNKPSKMSLRLAISMILGSPGVYANPTGAHIINGQVSIDNSTHGVMNISNSPNAIINWQGFSINQNEITQFIQQNSQSAVLNRVIGQNPSAIMGQLISNGRVFLINPNGIVFGANSIINTQGLIASTLNLSNEDFLSGNYHFSADNGVGDIVNEGIIRAGADGNIILIAPNIENNGIIQTEGGKITLAAGEELTLTNLDEPEIQFQIQAPDNQILNLGKVLTEGGAIELFAGNITHSGELIANSIEMDKQGNIRLIAQQDIDLTASSLTTVDNSVYDAGNIEIKSQQGTTLVAGQVTADSDQETGGHIEILGHHVGLTEQAQISASGTSGGGEILVGGDYKGGNPEVMNAEATYIGEQVAINADATVAGDGGKVIIWSDEATRVYGSISATGGAESGNGGFVETSGHYLDVTSTPNVGAENGSGGTWLLDPYDIKIIQGSTNTTITTSPSFTFSPTGNTSIIGVDNINTALNNDTNVTIDTANNGGSQEGDVIFEASVDKSSGTGTPTFTINADGKIDFVSGSVLASGSSTLVIDFTADRDNDGNGGINIGSRMIQLSHGNINLTTRSGDIVLGVGGSIRTADGNITLQTDDLIIASNASISSSGFTTIIPNSNTQDIHIGSGGAGDLSISEVELGNIFADKLTIGRSTDTGTLTIDAAVKLTSADLESNTLSLKHQNIVIDGSVDLSGDNENLNLTASNLVDINNAITTGNGLFSINSPTVNLNPAGGTIKINGAYSITTTNLDGVGTIDFLDNYTFNTFNQSNGSFLSSNNSILAISNSYNWTGGTLSENLTVNGNTFVDGNVTLNSIFNNNGSLTWHSGTIDGTGSFNNNSGGTFIINGNNLFDLAFTNAGTLTKSAGTGTSSFESPFINSGTVNANSGSLQFNGGYTQTAEVTSLGGGKITVLTGTSNFNGGILKGSGTFTVGQLNINSAATFAPGNSPGTFNVEGDLQLAGTTLIEIQGLSQGFKYDFINVTGNVFLGGNLRVATAAYSDMALGDFFDIIRSGGSIRGNFANSVFSGGINYGNEITPTPTYRLVSFFQKDVNSDSIIGLKQIAIDPNLAPSPYGSETIDGASGDDESDKAVVIEPNDLKQCI